MATGIPRIEKVRTQGFGVVRIKWRGRAAFDAVNLTGWIATGGKTLKPLLNPGVFANVRVINYGAAIGWDDEGDLAIDALHLSRLAAEQKPFTSNDAQRWQYRVRVSNNEVADLLGVSLSTWNAYKAGQSSIPTAVAIALRAAERDPMVMQAHYRPRTTGRPRKAAAKAS